MNNCYLLNTAMESLPPSKHQKSEVNILKYIVGREDTLSKKVLYPSSAHASRGVFRILSKMEGFSENS